jgi:hypothetical protein
MSLPSGKFQHHQALAIVSHTARSQEAMWQAQTGRFQAGGEIPLSPTVTLYNCQGVEAVCEWMVENCHENHADNVSKETRPAVPLCCQEAPEGFAIGSPFSKQLQSAKVARSCKNKRQKNSAGDNFLTPE